MKPTLVHCLFEQSGTFKNAFRQFPRNTRTTLFATLYSMSHPATMFRHSLTNYQHFFNIIVL